MLPIRRGNAADTPSSTCTRATAPPGARIASWRAGTIATLVAAGALAGCGGGPDAGDGMPLADAPVVEATIVAPVDDVDRLTVKGIEFDAGDAPYVDDEGIERPIAEIDVGVTVEVDAQVAADGSSGVARRVKSTVALLGPVDAVANDTVLVALGTPVRTDASTTLAGVESVAALRPGDPVRVHGLHAADGTIVATRLERAAAPFQRVRLRGTVGGLDAADQSFALGPLRVSYRGAAIRGSLADGARVLAWSDRPPVDGRWTVTAIDVEPAARFQDGASVAIEGLVSGFASLADFVVGGVRIDGRGASVVGDPASLRDGVRVTVRGTWRGDRVEAASIGFFSVERPRTIVGIGPVFGTPLFWGPGYWGPGWFPWVPASGVLPGAAVRGPFQSSWLARPVPPRPPGPIPSGAGGAFSRPAPLAPSLSPSARPDPPSVRPVPSPAVRPVPGGPRGGWLGSRGRGGSRGR